MSEIVERVKKYAGAGFDRCRLSNPCITKRETIELANYIALLESEPKKNTQLIAFLKSLSRYEEVNGSGAISSKLDGIIARLEKEPDTLGVDEIDALASEVQDSYM